MSPMRFLYYELTAQEPLIVGDHSELGNMVRTLDYIPGTALRGLFAALYLKANGSAYRADGTGYSEMFRSLFLSERVHFYNAYPLHGRTGGKTVPMPMSVFGCKYFGQNVFDSLETQHGVTDMLFEKIPDDFVCDEEFEGGICGLEMKHKDGYLYRDTGELRTLRVEKRIDAHVNIDEDGLYAFEAVERGTRFYGYVGICEESFDDCARQLEKLADGGRFRVGKAKGRGYGLVSAEVFEEAEDPFPTESVAPVAVGSKGLIGVYCYSDVILENELGQYLSHIPPECVSEGLELEKGLCFWKNDVFRGFNVKRKMPLPKRGAIRAGSVMVYRVADPARFDPARLPRSIGLLQNAGFGKLVYNHKQALEDF